MKAKGYDQPCGLMQETIRLIKERGVNDAAFETRLPFGWLQKLIGGQVLNPSVNRVVHAYECLSKTKIKV